MMYKRAKGFSLVELLVVISVTAMLMSLMMPAMLHAKRQARKIFCLSNLNQWGLVWKMFTDDHDDKFLLGLDWVEPLFSYYKDPSLLICPCASRPNPDGSTRGGKNHAWLWTITLQNGLGGNPGNYAQASNSSAGSNREERVLRGSYGLNFWCTHSEDGGRFANALWTTPNLRGGFEAPIFSDCSVTGFAPLHADSPPDYDGQIYCGGTNVDEIKASCFNRHPGGTINALFVDFSARQIGLKEMWELKWNRRWFVERNGLPDYNPPAEFSDPDHWMYPLKDY